VELATCHASNQEAAAEIGSLSVEATVAEALSGLATVYLAAEAFFRPIWGRYFTTEYPPDRSTNSLVRLTYIYFTYLYLHFFLLYQTDGLAAERGAGGGACVLGEGEGFPEGLRHLQLVRPSGTPGQSSHLYGQSHMYGQFSFPSLPLISFGLGSSNTAI
jgi:hypothetical protein